jgi:hypothetical protein
MSTVKAISFKLKATGKRLKKEILSDDFKKRKIFWKNIAENFHLTSLFICEIRSMGKQYASMQPVWWCPFFLTTT